MKKVEREIKRAVEGMKGALSRKDFDQAVGFHDEEISLRRRAEELKVKYEEENQTILEVTRNDVEEVISKWTGIPLSSVMEEEKDKLLNMEEHLHRRIVGQEEAILGARRARSAARAPGSRALCARWGRSSSSGPTGVGKTEVARTLAEFLFGNERALLRFDMSSTWRSTRSPKMIGSPPGYIGHERRPAHRAREAQALQRHPPRRDREGAPGHPEHPPPGTRRRDDHRTPTATSWTSGTASSS